MRCRSTTACRSSRTGRRTRSGSSGCWPALASCIGRRVRAARTRGDRPVLAAERTPLVVGGTGPLLPCSPRGARVTSGARNPARVSGGDGSTTMPDTAAHAHSSEVDPAAAARHPSERPPGALCVRSSSRRPDPSLVPTRGSPLRRRLAPSHPPGGARRAEAGARPANHGTDEANAKEPASRKRCAMRSAQTCPSPRERSSAWDEVATLPPRRGRSRR